MGILDVLRDLEQRFADFNTTVAMTGSELTSADTILKVIDWLKHYGYLANEGTLTPQGVVDAITKVQEVIGILTVDGKLGPKTFTALMNTPRCARPDHSLLRSGAITESIWARKHLTYYVSRRDTDMSTARWDEILELAFDAWANVSGLTFERVDTTNKAKLIMSVGTGETHNFDGPGRVLAWAQLPPTRNYDGQLLMRFDTNETWTEYGSGRGIHLVNVATHEIGHMLGLDHSSVSTALMAPFYNARLKDPQQNDDVTRVQNFYGKGTGSPPIPTPEPPPTPNPEPEPDVPAPSDLRALLGEGTVTLTWRDNSIGEEGFEIFKNGVSLSTVRRGVTRFVDRGVQPGQTYAYRVRTKLGGQVSEFSNSATVNIPRPEPEPEPEPTPAPDPDPLEELIIKVRGRDMEVFDISDHRVRKLED